MDERLARTQTTSMKIKSFHYNLVEKWESDFDRERKENSEIIVKYCKIIRGK